MLIPFQWFTLGGPATPYLALRVLLSNRYFWRVPKRNFKETQMQTNTRTSDQWIVNQLLGIRMLEQELASALGQPSLREKAQLRARIRQLSAWVDAVDNSLSAAAGQAAGRQ